MKMKKSISINGVVYTWQGFLYDVFTHLAAKGPMEPDCYRSAGAAIGRAGYLWGEFCNRFKDDEDQEMVNSEADV